MSTEHIAYRQGDVLLEKLDSLPQGLTELAAGVPVVVAEGETTGHSHRIASPRVRLFIHPGTQATYVEIADALAMLEHEEHRPIRLGKGVYQITLQREYMPQQPPPRVCD